MSELFDTSAYASSLKITSSFQVKGKKKPQKQEATDPSWDEPFGWQSGDIAKIIDFDQRVLTALIESVDGDFAIITFPDYQNEQVTTKRLPLRTLIATGQTFHRRDAWKLAPILLEKLGAGSGRAQELAAELTLPLGQVSQCLEKLEREGKVCHCSNWIYSLVQEEVSPSQELNSDSTLSESPTMMNSAPICSVKDSPEYSTLGESLMTGAVVPVQTCGQLPLLANPSQLGENEGERLMNATVSLHSCVELNNSNPDLSSLKTSSDFSTALTFQEANSSIFPGSLKGYPASGTMRTGKLFPALRLVPPGKEKGSSLLPTPTALSSLGKGPGLMKLEIYLRKLGAIAPNHVVNPVLLEAGMGLPHGWTNPRLPYTAQEFAPLPKSEVEEKPLEMDSISELQPLPSKPLSDSWNPKHFGEVEYQEEGGQLTIFYKCDDEPPCPEDCKNLEEFEEKWAQWEAKFPELANKFLEESEGINCDDTQVAVDYHQNLLEKAQSEVDENLDEDELYSHITAAEIIEQEEWEKPYTATPREAKSYAKGQTGQLYSYGQRKKSSYLNPDSHYYWGYSYQIWDGFKWRSKSKSVPLSKLNLVRQAIADKLLVQDILSILKK